MLHRIVVVDDEAIQRNILSKILEKIKPEAEIIACSNGQEAYDVIRTSSVDLLITDISMPVMDGMVLIEKVSVEFSRMKIALISAYQEFEYAKTAIRCGVTEYLIKPFRVEDARKLIEKIEDQLYKERENDRLLNQYEQMVEASRKQNYENNLYQLITGARKAEQLLDSGYDLFHTNGVISVIRWKVKEKTKENGIGIRERQQETLINHLKESFLNAKFIMLERGLDQMERKLAMLLPDSVADQVEKNLQCLLKQLSQDGIFFWGGGVGE